MIPFNKPHITGKEIDYINDALSKGKISGNGIYTKKCHNFFKLNYGFEKCLITQSCTDALEMAAILCNIQPGDEVIVPSYTFVSTANAFALRGAKIVFADSLPNHPNIDHDKIEELITNKEATFFAKVNGQSMIGAGLDDNDLLVIDRSLEPENNKIAVCFLDGEFTVKRLKVRDNEVWLQPENPNYPIIKITEENDFVIWGIVTSVIKKV